MKSLVLLEGGVCNGGRLWFGLERVEFVVREGV